MKIAVAGGTGVVGTHVVDVARQQGHETVILTRAHGVDLRTGAGLSPALDGVEVVVDVANVPSTSAEKSIDFFTTTARTLGKAATLAGVRHHVVLSIVGVDRAREGYYAGKLAQEDAIAQGRSPGPSSGRRSSMSSPRSCLHARRSAPSMSLLACGRSRSRHARSRAPLRTAVSEPVGRRRISQGPARRAWSRRSARSPARRAPGMDPGGSPPGGFGRRSATARRCRARGRARNRRPMRTGSRRCRCGPGFWRGRRLLELVRRDPQVGLIAVVADECQQDAAAVQQARIVHCIAVGGSGK